MVTANLLYTLIQPDNSKHSSRAISRLSGGRKIHVLSRDIEFPDPHVRGQQATRSHRRSRANSFSLGYTEKVTKTPSLSKWNLFPGLYLYFYVLTIILNFSFKVYKSFLICKTVSKHAVIYAPNSLCSTKTNKPHLQGFSVNCPVFWQLCCRTGHFHDDDIWLQLPVFISFLFSYSNLASCWGLTTALICTRKEHRRTRCSSCSKMTSSCNLSYCRHFSHVANFLQIWSTVAG